MLDQQLFEQVMERLRQALEAIVRAEGDWMEKANEVHKWMLKNGEAEWVEFMSWYTL